MSFFAACLPKLCSSKCFDKYHVCDDDDDDNNEALGLKLRLRLCTEMDETSGWSTDCRGQLCLLMMITVVLLMNMVMVISHGLKD